MTICSWPWNLTLLNVKKNKKLWISYSYVYQLWTYQKPPEQYAKYNFVFKFFAVRTLKRIRILCIIIFCYISSHPVWIICNLCYKFRNLIKIAHDERSGRCIIFTIVLYTYNTSGLRWYSVTRPRLKYNIYISDDNHNRGRWTRWIVEK